MFHSSIIKRIIDTFCRIIEEVDECKKLNASTQDDLMQIKAYHERVLEERKALMQLKYDAKDMPWLSKIYADYYYLRDINIAKYLEIKKNPAEKAADEVRKIATEKKQLLQELKQTQYKLEYYETLFPSLTDYVDEPDDLTEIVVETDEQKRDEVLMFVSKEEYVKLSVSDRNQLALDRYKKRKHSKSHIGKMYERYIGWLYEKKGYKVTYYGIKNGLNDLGRDLICENESEICVVQCKCWSKGKKIHENAICQLYGSTVKFKLENRANNNSLFNKNIKAVFITTTQYSDTALVFASELNVECCCGDLSLDYPLIKCNISVTGEKIYHLPFDQQYDTTMIDKEGEMYAITIQQAENEGFRRAKRWYSR